MPPKMKFETPIFHPNGTLPTPIPNNTIQQLYAERISARVTSTANSTLTKPSLPLRRSLYINPAPPRRRQIRLRIRGRTLVTRADARDDSA